MHKLKISECRYEYDKCIAYAIAIRLLFTGYYYYATSQHYVMLRDIYLPNLLSNTNINTAMPNAAKNTKKKPCSNLGLEACLDKASCCIYRNKMHQSNRFVLHLHNWY